MQKCGLDRRHAVSKINRSVSMKIVMEYSKRCIILVVRKRPKTISQRRQADKRKSF